MARIRPSQITILPANISSDKYFISFNKAERLVSEGKLKWLVNGVSAREQGVRPRGEQREWRKTLCIDPNTNVGIHTMQLVVPADLRSFGQFSATPNTRSNGKRRARKPAYSYKP